MDEQLEQSRGHTLHPLKELDHWKVSEQDEDVRGWELVDRNDHGHGTVVDMLVDEDLGTVALLIVASSDDNKHRLVPLQRVSLDSDQEHVVFEDDLESLRNSPYYIGDTDYGHFFDYWSGKVTRERELAHGRKGGQSAILERESRGTRHRGKLSVNTASREELIDIPGIGPAMADRILHYRETHGRVKDLYDLDEIEGISRRTIESLREHLKV
jgi:competence ComEA-like helix-hairpin-helix protein